MTLNANQIAAVRDVEATWPAAMPTLIGAAALGFHLDGTKVFVAPAFVVSFLKMVSYLDRPHDRERDLNDIANLMEGYIADDDERRWSGEVNGDVDYDSVSAFLLGRDMASVLAGAAHWTKVDVFMSGALDESSTSHTTMAEFCSPASKLLFSDRLQQLQAGLDQGRL